MCVPIDSIVINALPTVYSDIVYVLCILILYTDKVSLLRILIFCVFYCVF